MFKFVRAGLVSAALLVPVLAGCQSNASTATATPTSAAAAATTVPKSTPTTAPVPDKSSEATPGPRPVGPVPEPWGIAANGVILYGTTTGDIVSMNPADGAMSTLARDTEGVPVLSPDGTRLLYERRESGARALWVADIDGTDARVVLPNDRHVGWLEWAPDSHRILMVPGSSGDVTILDIDTGSTTTVHAPVPVRVASFLPGGRLLVGTASSPGKPAVFATIAEDGTGYTVVPTKDAVDEAYSISGDGKRFTYMGFGTEPGTKGLIHVVDLADGSDVLLTKADPNVEVLAPVFSPDERWIKADRWDVDGFQVVLLPADGKGKLVELGPRQTEGETFTTWAPDASALFVTYRHTGETWRFDVASGTGAKVDWPDLGTGIGWQRVAP